MKGIHFVIVTVLYIFAFSLGVLVTDYHHTDRNTPHIEYGPAVLSNQIAEVVLLGEPIKCQFEEPISIVVSVLHYYDNYEELNLDWQTYGVAEEDDEVWGFSDCEWQSEYNYAACDVYTVYPKYVDDTEDNPVFETIGHEVYHGACGDFHE